MLHAAAPPQPQYRIRKTCKLGERTPVLKRVNTEDGDLYHIVLANQDQKNTEPASMLSSQESQEDDKPLVWCNRIPSSLEHKVAVKKRHGAKQEHAETQQLQIRDKLAKQKQDQERSERLRQRLRRRKKDV